MARLFTAASGDIASYGNVILSGVPITLVCWAKASVTGASQTLLTLRDKDNSNFARSCFLLAQGSADTVTALQGSTTGSNSSAIGTVSSGVWYHAAAVFASNSSRTAYLNGTAGTEATSSVTTAGVDSAQIGASLISTSTVNTGFTGDIAEAAVYNVALTTAEIAMLAAGYSPLMVRPDALVAYWPVVGRNSPETDIVGNYDLTLTGTSASEHPRIIRPSAKILTFPSAASSSTTVAVPKASLVLTGRTPTVSVTNNVTVSVPKGSLILSGKTPVVIASDHKIVSVPKGSLVLRGYAPTVLGTVVAATNRGSYSESDRKLRERLRRLAIQQAHIEDDEEALAILLATIMREYR